MASAGGALKRPKGFCERVAVFWQKWPKESVKLQEVPPPDRKHSAATPGGTDQSAAFDCANLFDPTWAAKQKDGGSIPGSSEGTPPN